MREDDGCDAYKDTITEQAQFEHSRQREQRAAQQHDEDQYAAAVDEGTYGGTYSVSIPHWFDSTNQPGLFRVERIGFNPTLVRFNVACLQPRILRKTGGDCWKGWSDETTSR